MRVFRTAPYWCAAMHVVAGIGALTLLRGGSEAIPNIRERIAYLARYPERWRAGWLLWMLAALTLLAFYAWWGNRIGKLWPVAIAAVGLACDWSGESIFIGWIPRPDTRLYRTAALLTGGAGNGLYTIAAIALTRATRQLPWRSLAWCAWSAGAGLTITTIAGSDAGITVTSALLMLFFIPWVVIAGKRMP
ncbi:MAG: hypothetical protein M3041_06570 [Acidobacteriota bacterium]|nr:hypothetical protein [Acidobacteriota bacterium]